MVSNEKPADGFRLNGSDPISVEVRDTSPEGSATRLYSVVACYGWAEQILCTGAYRQHANGIARAVAAAAGCPWVGAKAAYRACSLSKRSNQGGEMPTCAQCGAELVRSLCVACNATGDDTCRNCGGNGSVLSCSTDPFHDHTGLDQDREAIHPADYCYYRTPGAADR